MTDTTSLPQDALDQKLSTAFDGKVVRKDLVRKVNVHCRRPGGRQREDLLLDCLGRTAVQ